MSKLPRKPHESAAEVMEGILKGACDDISEVCPKAHIVFMHFLRGTDDMPGAIRLSTVNSKNGIVHDVMSKEIAARKGESISLLHEEALKKHVQNLSRSNTFLHFVERELNTLAPPELHMKIVPMPSSSDSVFSYIGDTEKQTPEKITIKKSYSIEFAKKLVPIDRAREYLSALYKKSDPSEYNQYTEEFSLYQACLLSNVLKDNQVGLSGKDHNSRPNREMMAEAKRSLMEIQSALLFSLGESTNPYSELNVVAYRVNIEGKPLYAVAIIAGQVTQRSIASVSKTLIIYANKAASDSLAKNEFDDLNNEAKKLLPSYEPFGGTDFKTLAHSVYDIYDQQIRSEFLCTMFVELLTRLSSSIHEGNALEFWLVIGDRSEFEDHPNTFFRKLSDEETDSLRFEGKKYNDVDTLRRQVRLCANQLTKEHFPWFFRGRNALFFDVTRKSSAPCGLVSIKGSSWGQVISESYGRSQDLDLPSFFLGHVGGTPRETGLITYRVKGSDSKLKRVMRYRDHHWELLGLSQRRRILEEKLKKHLKVEDDALAELNELLDICLSVADNPQTGGTIVFVDVPPDDYLKLFSKLGNHWGIDDNIEDKMALIGHDGATLVQCGARRWGYRFFLSSDGTSQKIRSKLAELAEDKNIVDHPLKSVGSRRWSAALASFTKEVLAVVVISQDGGMYCWFPNNNDRPTKEEDRVNGSHVCKFPSNGIPSIFSMNPKDKTWGWKDLEVEESTNDA
jgi:hypothetical protein